MLAVAVQITPEGIQVLMENNSADVLVSCPEYGCLKSCSCNRYFRRVSSDSFVLIDGIPPVTMASRKYREFLYHS